MLTYIFALMAGIGIQELFLAFLIFTVPLFFLIRWILGKVWTSGSRRSINIVSFILGLVLSPVVAWLTIMAVVLSWGNYH